MEFTLKFDPKTGRLSLHQGCCREISSVKLNAWMEAASNFFITTLQQQLTFAIYDEETNLWTINQEVINNSIDQVLLTQLLQNIENYVTNYFEDNPDVIGEQVNNYLTNNTQYFETIVTNLLTNNTELFQQYFDNSVANYFQDNTTIIGDTISNYLTENTQYFGDVITNLLTTNTELFQQYFDNSVANYFEDNSTIIGDIITTYLTDNTQYFGDIITNLLTSNTDLFQQYFDNSVANYFEDNSTVIGDVISNYLSNNTNYFGDIITNLLENNTELFQSYFDNSISNYFEDNSSYIGDVITTFFTDNSSYLETIITNIFNDNPDLNPLDTEEIQDIVGAMIYSTSSLAWNYDDTNGRIFATVRLQPFTTDDLREGTTNLYFKPEYLTGFGDDLYAPLGRTLTINGTSGRIGVTGGTQTLAANRTWAVDLSAIHAGLSGGSTTATPSIAVDTYGRVTGLTYSTIAFPEETDPTVPSWVKAITTTNISNWNSAFSWGNHALAGYLTSYTETDPTVPSWVKAITTTNISNWNTAFGWGNHAGLYSLLGHTHDDRYPQLSGSYSNPSWLVAIDASKITTGTIDPARLPPTSAPIISPGGIADLTSGQQALISAGTPIVITTDGNQWVYKGTGSKTDSANYIQLGAGATDWTSITNKPTTVSGYGITDVYTKTESDARFVQLAGSYSNPSWITSLAWTKITGAPSFLTSYTETDPTVGSHIKAITTTNISNWNTAFGWGNHAGLYAPLGRTLTINGTSGRIGVTGGSQTLAADRIWAVDLSTIHAGLSGGSTTATPSITVDAYGRVTGLSYSTIVFPAETDPTVGSHIKAITTTNISNWNSAFGWGNHALAGYLTSYTETDPTVPSHVKSITTTEKANWNTAFGWGNHAGLYTPLGRTLTINGTSGRIGVTGGAQTLAADRIWAVDLSTIHLGLTGGSTTTTPSITVDTYGRVTGLTYSAIAFPAETDPTVGSHIKAITTTNISNWNTAFGWGNHSGQYVLKSGDTMSGALIVNAPITAASTIKLWRGGGSVVNNIGLGEFTLNSNTSGIANIAIGQYVLGNNTTGSSNVGIGASTMVGNTTGGGNVGIGSIALYSNQSGNSNVAVGVYALSNVVSSWNTGVGYNVFNALTLGYGNVGMGYNVGSAITTGVNNILFGNSTGTSITTGSGNVVIGSNSAARIATLNGWILVADGYGTERFSVSPNGNLLINQTSDNSTDKVQITGSVRSTSYFATNYGTPLILESAGNADVWMKNGAAFNVVNSAYNRYNLSVKNSGQIQLGAYTSSSSFTGTVAGILGFDSSGNVLTTSLSWSNLSGIPSLSYAGHTHIIADVSGLQSALDSKTPYGHTHDDRYYTESEVNSFLSGKADWGHNHDDRYYTESEVNSLLSGKADWGHNHDDRYYTQTQLNTSGAGGIVHWNNISGKPSTYPPEYHTHSMSEIIGLYAEFGNYYTKSASDARYLQYFNEVDPTEVTGLSASVGSNYIQLYIGKKNGGSVGSGIIDLSGIRDADPYGFDSMWFTRSGNTVYFNFRTRNGSTSTVSFTDCCGGS